MQTNLLTLFTFLTTSFLISLFIIPRILRVVRYKQIMDEPNERSSHLYGVPNLGGIAFYIVLVLGIFLSTKFDADHASVSILTALMILFLTGLKDDLANISPLKKSLAQIAAATVVVSNPAFQLDSLHGFLGIYELPLWLSIASSVFIIVFLINAFNLIDGIDGMASLSGIGTFLLLAFFLHISGAGFYALLAVMMAGTLLAFLGYNLSRYHKIFMGDTGSMMIGFVAALLMIKLIGMAGLTNALPFAPQNVVPVVIAFAILPIFDAIRVSIVRILNKKSPFQPDRNHIHHLFIRFKGLNHRQTSFLLNAVGFLTSLSFIAFGMFMHQLVLLSSLLLVSFAASIYLFMINEAFSSVHKKYYFIQFFNRLTFTRTNSNRPLTFRLKLKEKEDTSAA